MSDNENKITKAKSVEGIVGSGDMAFDAYAIKCDGMCLVYVANDVGEIDAEDLRDHLIWPVKNFIEGTDPFRELQEEIYLLRRQGISMV